MTSRDLTKSEFLEFRHCAKSFWLKAYRPETVRWPAPSTFDRLLMKDGYAVEAVARLLVETWDDAACCEFQVEYRADGLLARADLVRRHDDGSISLYEIKGSTSLRSSSGRDHVDDATFQTIVIERAGQTVRAVHIVHVNKDYVRAGEIDPLALLQFVDVTFDVRARIADIGREIDEALTLLTQESIDESGCTCVLIGNRANHCAAFEHFNPDVSEPSVYLLPRISSKKLEGFHSEGRLSLDKVEPSELTPLQQVVLRAALQGEPIINRAAIAQFLDGLTWPLQFYDYETFASAIPNANGHRPHQAMPGVRRQHQWHRFEVLN